MFDIKELIGEATEYDKKQVVERKQTKSWLKSVSAFANSFGGTLIWGITNDDEVVGLENAESDAEFISETIKMKIDSMPRVNLRFHMEDDKNCSFLLYMQGKKHRIIMWEREIAQRIFGWEMKVFRQTILR